MGSNVVLCAYVLKCTFPGNIMRVKQSAVAYFVCVVIGMAKKKKKKKRHSSSRYPDILFTRFPKI